MLGALDDQGEEADLELHAGGANVIAVTPYPFRRDPLSFSIMARRVSKKIYSSDLDFQKALAIFRTHDDERGMAINQGDLGIVQLAQGQYDHAIAGI